MNLSEHRVRNSWILFGICLLVHSIEVFLSARTKPYLPSVLSTRFSGLRERFRLLRRVLHNRIPR